MKVLWVGIAVYAMVTVITSIPEVRGWLIAPLYCHDSQAKGDIAYVMADGHATWERLRAASDLYHFKSVREIYLLEQTSPAGYNFAQKKLDSRTEREKDYLGLFGVPNSAIRTIPQPTDTTFGSLGEARSLYSIDRDFAAIVIVTSPPHTRRTKLCFERVFGNSAVILIHSAAKPSMSAETDSPIWLEYVKLIVYWFVAKK